MIHVKICGLTRLADARAALAAGADAIGFVLWPASPRAVDAASVRSILAGLEGRFESVGVFVDEDPAVVRRTIDEAGLSMAQLHGREDAAYLAGLGRPAYPAFRAGPDVEAIVRRRAPRRFLLDAYDPSLPGGTGRAVDHALARRLTGVGALHLAGGLSPANVAAALEAVRPAGVDASSGLESAPGIKDHATIQAFLDEVRRWERRTTGATSEPTAGSSSPRR